jgi:hypothetical protein
MSGKSFKLKAEEIRSLAPGRGGCFASDHITVEGHRVGYLYRERARGAWDSGWRFFSGLESDEYTSDPAHFAIYDVNTIANYDPEIIPLLDAPFHTAYARNAPSGHFAEVAWSPPGE